MNKQNKKLHHLVQTEPFAKLVEVMARLRSPDGGCPWDLAQDFKSIAPYTIEEAYEVADAIDRENMKDLKEELGDLLLQSIYHAQMASENGDFDIYDVIQAITDKMIHRHPHVFSDTKAQSPDDVNKIWDDRKDKEKQATTSVLDDVPLALPALLRSQKIQKRAARSGFEWPDVKGAMSKLHEEISELEEALEKSQSAEIAEEIGDVLFAVANVARMSDLNAEEGLRNTIRKFETRFKAMEHEIKKSGKEMKDMPLEQLLSSWNRQKKK